MKYPDTNPHHIYIFYSDFLFDKAAVNFPCSPCGIECIEARSLIQQGKLS